MDFEGDTSVGGFIFNVLHLHLNPKSMYPTIVL